MDVLSHPFRFERNGSAATVREGSVDANAEAVAIVVLTRKGERPMVPTFGVTDPVYRGLDVAEVNAVLSTFGPTDVTVAGVAVDYPTDTTERVILELED